MLIKAITSKITDFTVNHLSAEIDAEMQEAYQYGFEILISSIINIALIFISSLILGDIKAGLLFLLCFIPVRQYTGGYHATTYFRCNLAFLVSFLIVYLVCKLISSSDDIIIYAYEIILLISLIPIYIWAPVKNKHKRITEKQENKCRRMAIILYALLGFIALSFATFNNNMMYSSIIVITLVLISVMIIIEKLMQRRCFHEN